MSGLTLGDFPPVPFPPQYFCEFDVVRHGWVVQRWVNGIYIQDVGPVYRGEGASQAALKYAKSLDGVPQTSPLRKGAHI